jgi:hypothetical protein
MKIKELMGGYNDIRGAHSRKQHLMRELIHALYLLMLLGSLVNDRQDLTILLLAALPIDLTMYRLSVIRRLHDLGIPEKEVNLTFWQPIISYALWWRVLSKKGDKG